MKRMIRIIFCLLFTNIKFFFVKLFHFSKFEYSLFSICSPFTELDFTDGIIRLGCKFRMKSNCHIKSRKNANITIGNNVSLNHGCIIVAHEEIIIGDNCQIAPNVLIYDHDHNYKCTEGIKALEYTSSPINIGYNVWIGANCVILRGTKIGNNCVIGAGCVLKGTYPANSTIVQKRKSIIIGEKND